MPNVTFEEFRITFVTAQTISPAKVAAMRRTLASRRFRRELTDQIRAVVRRFPTIDRLRTVISV